MERINEVKQDISKVLAVLRFVIPVRRADPKNKQCSDRYLVLLENLGKLKKDLYVENLWNFHHKLSIRRQQRVVSGLGPFEQPREEPLSDWQRTGRDRRERMLLQRNPHHRLEQLLTNNSEDFDQGYFYYNYSR